ncbi:MAG: GTPase HflX [Pseudomonadota bacterium]
MVLVPDFSSARSGAGNSDAGVAYASGNSVARSAGARLQEAIGLAHAINLDVVENGVVSLRSKRASTLFGKGKTEEIAGIVKAENVGLAIVDHSLSPVQQHNLEKAWHCKVLDRTGLILEIFGDRARTKEGRLQVELAQLNYQKGRLVRQWTHLERQRGGLGKTGGPGETQIEADRRQLQRRILRLEKELEKVKRTRLLHRSKRKRVPTPIVALVGYTNAGKSTLFNRLTNANVLAKDLLFATLDPTLRELSLPDGSDVILSDTVGFVSDLPTTLVAAFRATLEEVVEADLILHVRDISDPENAVQSQDVYAVLEQIGIGHENMSRIVEVWNKMDLLSAEAAKLIQSTRSAENAPVMVSAITGQGTDELLDVIARKIGDEDRVLDIRLGLKDLKDLSWVYENAQVLNRQDNEDGTILMKIRVKRGRRQAFAKFAA